MSLNLENVSVGPRIKLLWKNPNPESSFSPQKVVFPAKDYDILMVMSTDNAGYGEIFSPVFYKKYGGLNTIIMTGNMALNRTRRGTVYDDGIEFAEGKAGTAVANQIQVPLLIYGLNF